MHYIFVNWLNKMSVQSELWNGTDSVGGNPPELLHPDGPIELFLDPASVPCLV